MATNATKVRNSLIQQLESKGASLEHFLKLVEDYVWYFEQVNKMKKNIKKRGTTYIATSSTGKEYEKDNPDVKMVPVYTKQMLQILKELGLTTDNINANEDDEL